MFPGCGSFSPTHDTATDRYNPLWVVPLHVDEKGVDHPALQLLLCDLATGWGVVSGKAYDICK